MKKVLAGIVAVVLVSMLGYTHRDWVESRFSCADKVAHQMATPDVVPGAYGCLDPQTIIGLYDFYGVQNAKDFAVLAGSSNARYAYLGQAYDGENENWSGFIYEIDVAGHPHNSIAGASRIVWNSPWVWKQSPESFNEMTQMIWAELNGETQAWSSRVLTFYLYPQGTKEAFTNLRTGKEVIFDVSGLVASIQ